MVVPTACRRAVSDRCANNGFFGPCSIKYWAFRSGFIRDRGSWINPYLYVVGGVWYVVVLQRYGTDSWCVPVLFY